MPLSRELPRPVEALADLALDLRWTWSRAGDALWRTIYGEAWEQTRNPWVMLQDVPRARLETLAADPAFTAELSRLVHAREQYMKEASWFEVGGPGLPSECVAFFSMEFGLGEAVPLYAGGLGILAGDYLKTASDLGLPAVGVGILFQEGYFRQTITSAGQQRESYPYNDPTTLPIQPACASASSCLAGTFGCASGARASAERISTCSTATIRPTPRSIAASRPSSTAEDKRRGCCRRSSSASAAGARCTRQASRPASRT